MADSARVAKFKKELKFLQSLSGQGTELVSVYIPYKYPREDINAQLSSEISQSSNIKSKRTRKNVQGALQRVVQYLKQIDYNIPENGLCIFSGALERESGNEKIELYALEPLQPIRNKIYRCDSKFYLEPLFEQIQSNDVYGLVVMDLRNATIALLKGKSYKIVYSTHSAVPGKIRAGGQSSVRFASLRKIAIHGFFKRVADAMNQTFLPMGKELKGIIMGGSGPTKEDFVNSGLLNPEVKAKILAIVHTGYTDENGIKELIQKSDEILKDTELMQEKKLVNKFIETVVKDGLATYGPIQVHKALQAGKVDILLISEKSPWRYVKLECNQCKKTIEKIVKAGQKLPETCECGGQLTKTVDLDYAEYLEDEAEKTGTKVEVISTETPEGKQFLDGFGGIGAFLRYK